MGLNFMKTFKGGIHPPDYKKLSKNKTIDKNFSPARVVISMIQHIGAECSPLIKKGDSVCQGDLIGTSDKFISASIHSSVSGKVVDIAQKPHPVLGRGVISVIIEKDDSLPNVEWQIKSEQEVNQQSIETLKEKIKKSGLVGLGGAAFPSFVKLSPPLEKKIDTLIINGVECEPFLTSDYRLMIEYPHEIIKGVQLFKKILNVDNVYIGIEANKKDAAVLLERVLNEKLIKNITVVVLKEKYPQGGEKQLISAVMGRKVPSGGLPMDVGVCVHNVGTAFAAYEIIYKDKPLFERVVTVTGDAINSPKNILVPVGALLSEIINYCGGLHDVEKLIMGGPMMGFAQYSLDMPVVKGTSGLLVLTSSGNEFQKEFPCIRCGRCVGACAVNLRPTDLYSLIKNKNFLEAKDENIFDCMECGACTYICPSKLDILPQIKKGKAKLRV